MSRRQHSLIEYLQEENRILKGKLQGKRLRFTDKERVRLAIKAKRLGRKALGDVACIVTPDTLLRWYRELVARKYDGSKNRRPGRPRTAEVIRNLIVKMASENSTWGYTRIRGALRNIGHVVSRSTIKRVLLENGIEPAPERGEHVQWDEFLKSHFGVIAATDFFTAEVLTFIGIVRYYVLFVIDLETRSVQIAGIIHQPHGDWMKQISKNLTDPFDGFLRNHRYLIHDRDPLFTGDFKKILAIEGIETVKLPPQSPDLNAYAERFVLSIKQECLNRIIPLGRTHLETAVREYVRHYNAERNHQGIGNELITPISGEIDPNSPKYVFAESLAHGQVFVCAQHV